MISSQNLNYNLLTDSLIYSKFQNSVQHLQYSEFTILRDHSYKYEQLKVLCILMVSVKEM